MLIGIDSWNYLGRPISSSEVPRIYTFPGLHFSALGCHWNASPSHHPTSPPLPRRGQDTRTDGCPGRRQSRQQFPLRISSWEINAKSGGTEGGDGQRAWLRQRLMGDTTRGGGEEGVWQGKNIPKNGYKLKMTK